RLLFLVELALVLHLQFLSRSHDRAPDVALMSRFSLDLDAVRLVALGSGQEQGEQAVAVLGLDAIRIDLDRQRQRPIELAGDAFPAMHAHAVGVVDALPARDADGVGLGLDLQVVLVDARQFHQGQDVVTLLEDVDGRERSATGGHVVKPVARKSCFELALKAEQRIEWIGKCGDHAAPLAAGIPGRTTIARGARRPSGNRFGMLFGTVKGGVPTLWQRLATYY